MTALLRSMQTGLYYVDSNRWTKEPGRARNFQLGTRAIQYAFDYCLQDVEIVLAFADPGDDLVVQIADLPARKSPREPAICNSVP